MNRRKILYFVVILSVGIGIITSVFLHNSSSNKKNFAQLIALPASLNLGDIWERDDFSWELIVENRDSEQLSVESISASCSCVKIEPKTFIIQPGEQKSINLKINLYNRPTPEMTISLMPSIKFPNSDREFVVPRWTLQGKVLTALKMDRHIYLGEYSDLNRTITKRVIPVEITVPLEKLSVESTITGVRVYVDFPEEGIGKSALRLEIGPSFPLGKLEGNVILRPVLKSGQSIPDQLIALTGEVAQDIASDPRVIQVGGRRIGETFEEMISLHSRTGTPYKVTHLSTEGNGLTIDVIDPEKHYRIRQNVVESSTAETKARLVVEVAGKTTEVIIPVQYTGLAY